MPLLQAEKEIQEIVRQTGLQHIAIIMDGNRRWAKERNLPSAFGHKKGVDALKAAMRACDDFGVKYLTVYAFSTENWNRNPEEVAFLMDLLGVTLQNELKEMHENNVVISFIGDTTKLSEKLQKILKNAVETTKNNTGVNLQIAFNYGARDEITNAVKNICKKVQTCEISPDEITEETISQNIYTKYLLWQIAYSEILVTKRYWPEFDKKALAEAIMEFQSRQRRYGK